MTKHIVIILAALLVAGAADAMPQLADRDTWATEEELLAAPGSAGYPVEELEADVVEDALRSPLCDCETDEGEDGFEDGGPADPGDEDGGGDADAEPEGDEDDTEGGC